MVAVDLNVIARKPSGEFAEFFDPRLPMRPAMSQTASYRDSGGNSGLIPGFGKLFLSSKFPVDFARFFGSLITPLMVF
jgi:hypothetical protein